MFKLVMRAPVRPRVAWAGAGCCSRIPETSFAVDARRRATNNNNITGFKDARVDECSTPTTASSISRSASRSSGRSTASSRTQHHYILEWDAPFERIAYWNKFGQPEGYLTRIGDYRDMPSLWWIDPQKERAAARRRWRDPSIKLPVGPTEVALLAGVRASTASRRAAASGHR